MKRRYQKIVLSENDMYRSSFKLAILVAIILHIGLLYSLKDTDSKKRIWEIPRVKPPVMFYRLPDKQPTPPPKQTPPQQRQIETSQRPQFRPPPVAMQVPVPAELVIEISETDIFVEDLSEIDMPEIDPPVDMPFSLDHPAIVAPVCSHRVQPVYPKVVERLGLSGITKLRCVINPAGFPENIQVVTSFNSACDNAAINAVRQWRYSPATLNDVPVSVFMDLVISYNPRK